MQQKQYKITYYQNNELKERTYFSSAYTIQCYIDLLMEHFEDGISELKIFKRTDYKNGNVKEEDITGKINRFIYNF